MNGSGNDMFCKWKKSYGKFVRDLLAYSRNLHKILIFNDMSVYSVSFLH